jgi:hypothetical protein
MLNVIWNSWYTQGACLSRHCPAPVVASAVQYTCAPCAAHCVCVYGLQVCDGMEVTAYYAGHVLGAAMLHVRVGAESVVYTGESLVVLIAVDVQPHTNRTVCGRAG